jgi:hypothetical protein
MGAVYGFKDTVVMRLYYRAECRDASYPLYRLEQALQTNITTGSYRYSLSNYFLMVIRRPVPFHPIQRPMPFCSNGTAFAKTNSHIWQIVQRPDFVSVLKQAGSKSGGGSYSRNHLASAAPDFTTDEKTSWNSYSGRVVVMEI